MDVDGTLISKDDEVRPYISELMRGLNERGCSITVWSAGGENYAESKWNMICNKIFYSTGEQLHDMVSHFSWKLNWESRALIGKHFYIDDEPAILSVAQRSGYGTHQVSFYEPILMKDDHELLDALEAARRFFNDGFTSTNAREIA